MSTLIRSRRRGRSPCAGGSSSNPLAHQTPKADIARLAKVDISSEGYFIDSWGLLGSHYIHAVFKTREAAIKFIGRHRQGAGDLTV